MNRYKLHEILPKGIYRPTVGDRVRLSVIYFQYHEDIMASYLDRIKAMNGKIIEDNGVNEVAVSWFEPVSYQTHDSEFTAFKSIGRFQRKFLDYADE